ncbi:MAG: CRISPR system precrRNA processing endoribonuclease RAMP protein Cas6 [Desulfuromonas sp.]|nr:CRISPR system precrRNA processing endoribonuclease RAMP protein Cas6 [Desulfuromonas sp.]
MSRYPIFPSQLAEAEFAMVRFGLDLLSPCTLDLGNLLGMRSLLHAAAGVLPQHCRATLFEPLPSSDPEALRRHQKPSPGFVLRPDSQLVGEHHEGDRLEFEVLFLGTGTLAISDFLAVLQALGERGLVPGEGRFEVVLVKGLGADGEWRRLWRSVRAEIDLAPELIRLDQWLDQIWPDTLPVILELTTPTRLVAGGRVLRRPRFCQIFPFLLRRVTSMLHTHCNLEPVAEPALLKEASASTESAWLESGWIDWRGGREVDEPDKVGGCVGRLRLSGPGLEDVLWVVLLATLFGIGRGAAYGAGRLAVR